MKRKLHPFRSPRQFIEGLMPGEADEFDVAALREVLAQIPADETVGAGDQDLHELSTPPP
jgi:hypothetical protein